MTENPQTVFLKIRVKKWVYLRAAMVQEEEEEDGKEPGNTVNMDNSSEVIYTAWKIYCVQP